MLIVDCGSARTPTIVEHVATLGHRPCVVHLDFLRPEHLEGVPGVIFTGSPRMLSLEGPAFFEQYSFVTEASVPMFGICFGHQFLGVLHGAAVMRGGSVNGMKEIWLEDDPLFKGIDPVTRFLQDHEEHISVPEGFIRLASSNYTAVEAMRHRTKPIFTVQFHPEISGADGFKLIENFAKLCVETVPYNRL